MGLQRAWSEDLQQRRLSLRCGTDPTNEETCFDPWAESKSQSRSEEYFQGRGHACGDHRRTLQDFYAVMVARGMKPAMARLTLARKIAAITLLVWKKGVCFDAEHLKQQAA